MAGCLILLAGLLPAAGVARAETFEMSQAELRQAVSERKVISPRRLVTCIEAETGGDVIDIRATISMGIVTYRIVLRHAAGTVDTLLINGTTGKIGSPR